MNPIFSIRLERTMNEVWTKQKEITVKLYNITVNIVLYPLLCLSLIGCMSSHPKVSVSSFDQAFHNGEIRLGCSLLCSMQFGASLSDMHQLYLQQRWHELSREIIEIGFNQDIAYYYLGRAAEGLGKTKAAEVYYLLSQSAPRCILNGCQGFSFPDVVNDRLANIKKYPSAPEVSSSYSNQKSRSSNVSQLENPDNNSRNECSVDSDCKSDEICKLTKSRFQCIKKPVADIKPQSNHKDKSYEIGNEIKLISVGGVYEIPVVLNEVLRINVILDSGAADVSISPDVVLTLIRTGTINKSDWLAGQVYQFADGTKSKSKRFNMRSITIGNKTFKNVTCSIAEKIDAPMLLGQSLLKKLGKYTIDYKKGIIQFE